MSTQVSRFTALVDQAVDVPFNWYGQGGTADTDVDNVSVVVTDAAGDTVSTGSAVGTDGVQVYTLPAQSAPGVFYLTWTDDDGNETRQSVVEVVGNFLFDEYDARNRAIKGVNPLSDGSAYPDDLINAGRTQVSDMFELRTGRSFVRRYCRAEFAGTGGRYLWAADGIARSSGKRTLAGIGRVRDLITVTACTVNGVAQTASDIVTDPWGFHHTNGYFTRAMSSSPFNVVVEYEYGQDPTPYEAQEEGLKMLFSNVVPSDVASRATSMSNEDGTFRLTTFPRTVEEFLRANDVRGIL